ncbi:adenylate/guanylate cyclase domain-containing protein [Lentisphaera profundi]|uniref:Adenylate/guanylate cyclase domain-containing protein n=1 Tax=Lentisphaera profundi TaxID=1658616 RepID=A0ABY7VTE3_9BACT|nr:adenylate/guanylate cyclase domain-containing protein [Lentisphaera profundi]WDE97476.1 adenylate/guanylate cyclase domain-containing protein [Lentisphaera profundi]
MTSFVEIVNKDKSTQQVHCLPITPIGRDSTNVVQLSDPLCSRNHAVINYVGKDKYYLIDMGSRNGVYLNNQRINNPMLLSDRDSLTIGTTKMIFHKHENSPVSGLKSYQHSDVQVSPEIRSVIILVADIRNFTQMSETLPIETLTNAMTYWFKATRNIIERNFGVVDKFIGDCVLAKWELKHPDPAAVPLILDAAYDIHRLTKTLPKIHPEVPDNIDIGCGINMGSVAMSENTILGDVVNTAFRLEEASKTLHGNIVMNHCFSSLNDSDILKREYKIAVKGKSRRLMVSSLSFEELENWLKTNPNPFRP